MEIEELRKRASSSLRWDQATLEKKMEEIVELCEAIRLGLEQQADKQSLRVALNEVTRRSCMIDLCREKFPAERKKIEIALRIADAVVSKVGMALEA